MSSDILGMVLDEFDLEDQIMTAIAKKQSTEKVAEVIEQTVQDHREAIQKVDQDLLIRDRFDLSEEDREILDVIEESHNEEVSEADIETLVREFFDEFGGEIRGSHPGPARESGDVFQVTPPSVITGKEVRKRYDQATFSRDVAREDSDAEFLALDHPVVQNIIDFSLQSDSIGGETAVKVGAEATPTPGLLCNFRLGYQSGDGESVTERLIQIYIRPDGSVEDDFELVGGIPSGDAHSFNGVDQVVAAADELVTVAENEAWARVSDMAEEAQDERYREVQIKRGHAERYFKSRIEDAQEQLERYEDRAADPGEDVQVLINKYSRRLKDISQEREEEMERLEQEEVVVPETPELVNAAVVIGI
jgi:uncharacterized protein YqeY